MSVYVMSQIKALAQATLTDTVVYPGYAPGGTRPPYAVVRPISESPAYVSLAGETGSTDQTYGVYCVGDSVLTSHTIASKVLSGFQGARVGIPHGVIPSDSVATATLTYTGALVDGLYESLVTVSVSLPVSNPTLSA